MELRHIRLTNFRRFENLDESFGPGLNVIKGPNEAGKSTIHTAIMMGLFDRPTGKKSEEELRKWGSKNLYQIELTYAREDGQEVTIRKNYDARTHQVISPEGTDTSREGLENAIAGAVGTNSERLFASTACIRQDEMTELDKGSNEISRQLQKIVMGGKGEVNRVIDKLDSKVREYTRGWKTSAPKNPGPVKILKDRISEIQEWINSAQNSVHEKQKAHEALISKRERLAMVVQELEPDRDAIKTESERRSLDDVLEVEKRQEDELEGRLDRVNKASEQVIEVRKGLAEVAVFEQRDDTQKKSMQDAHEVLQKKEALVADRKNQLEGLLERATGHKETRPKSLRLQKALVIGGGAIAVVGIISLLFLPQRFDMLIGLPFSAGGTLISFVGLIWGLILYMRRGPDFQVELEEAQKRIEQGHTAYNEAAEMLNEKLTPLGCESWQDYLEKQKNFDDLNNDLRSAEAARDAALGSAETLESLTERLKETRRKRRDIDSKLEEIADIPKMTAPEYHRLSNKVESLEKEKGDLESDIQQLEWRLELKGPTLEDLNRLNEQLAEAQRESEYAIERYHVLNLTLDVMQKAREDTMRTAQDELGPRMSAYVKRLTAGRYDHVDVDKRLAPQVSHPSKESGPIDERELSTGTRDQIYMAARLALCDLVFGETRPPLLMDDPFGKFDSERRDQALKLCHELSAERQIILFTCHDAYDSYADRLIDLTQSN